MAKKKIDSGSKRSKYGLTHDMIAKMFGMKGERSLNSSTAKERYLGGVESVIEHVEGQIVEKLK